MTKSLLCNVAILLGMSFISESLFQKCVSRSSDSLVMRPDAYQCPEVSNCSRLHPDQCSTRNRISFSDTDMGRQLHPSRRQVYTVQTLFLIRQDVEKKCNRPDVRATPSGRQSLLWKLSAAKVQPFGR
jgi:hypothetical protein